MAGYGQPQPQFGNVNAPVAQPVYASGGVAQPAIAQVGGQGQGGPTGKGVNESQYKDVWAAILFVVNVAVICYLAFTKGVSEYNEIQDTQAAEDADADAESASSGGKDLLAGVIIMAVFGCVISAGWVKFMLSQGEGIIHCMMKFTIALFAFCGLLFFVLGSVIGGLIFLVFAAINACYYRAVYDRIAFASVNLKCACTAILKYPSTVNFAILALPLQIMWYLCWIFAYIGVSGDATVTVTFPAEAQREPAECVSYAYDSASPIWSTASGGATTCGNSGLEWCTAVDNSDGGTSQVCTSTPTTGDYCCYCTDSDLTDIGVAAGECAASLGGAEGLIYFGMLVSFYWGSTVIQNVVHCITCGAVASWWFQANPGPHVVSGSFKRAMTTSFGSICFGSLLVAILKAIRQMIREAINEAQKKGNAFALQCLNCILGIIEQLMEIFNRYAFVYVATYGNDFKTAGKAVFQLFKSKGWTLIINDDLIENALILGCLVCGALTGVTGYALSTVMDFGDSSSGIVVVGVILGIVLGSACLGVISSAVATIFVCFAEDPAAGQATQPQLFSELIGAWMQFHGDVMTSCGYNQYHRY